MNTLKINEIFYSIQGEGYRKGTANLFIRLAGCTASKACANRGIVCDTDYVDYQEYTIYQLIDVVEHYKNTYGNKNIIWTGGEPTDQLTEDIFKEFHNRKYYQSIECSGIRVPQAPFRPKNDYPYKNLDFVSLSPKLKDEQIIKIWNNYSIDEVRVVLKKGEVISDLLLDNLEPIFGFYVSPHFNDEKPDWDNIQWCIDYVKANPKLILSVQEHKFLGVR